MIYGPFRDSAMHPKRSVPRRGYAAYLWAFGLAVPAGSTWESCCNVLLINDLGR